MAQMVGSGLFVRVDVNIDAAKRNLDLLRNMARKTSTEMARLGRNTGAGNNMNQLANASRNAATASRQLATSSQKTSQNLRVESTSSRALTVSLQKSAQVGRQVSTSNNEISRTARRAATSMQGLGTAMRGAQAGMYRFSQSFVNLRYGNPLGVLVGLTQGFTSLAGAATKVGGPIGIAVLAIGAIAASAAGAALALGAFAVGIGKFGIAAASSLEMTRISYEGLLGSAAKARVEVEQLQALAKQSIVPTQSLLDANRLLLAYGVTADDTRRKLMRFFSDFAAATGLPASRLSDMAYALGQVQSQGKANAIDMRQLANAGLNLAAVYGVIATQQKITTEEAKNLVTEGRLTAEILYPAILKIGEAYKITGDKARQSFSGIMANLTDVLQVQASVGFESTIAKLVPMLQGVEAFLERLEPMWANMGQAIGNTVTYLGEALSGVFGDANEQGDDLAYFFNYTLPEAVNYLGYALAHIVKTFRIMYSSAEFMINGITAAALGAVTVIMHIVASSVGILGTLLGPFGDAVRSTGNDIQATAMATEQATLSATASATAALRRFTTEFTTPIVKRATIVVNATGAVGDNGLYDSHSFSKYTNGRIPIPTGGISALPPAVGSSGGGGGGGGGGGAGTTIDKAKDQATKYLAWAKDWSGKLDAAWTKINASMRRQFGELSEFQKAMRSGSISSVINMYNSTSTELQAAYGAMIKLANGNKKQIRQLRKDAESEESYLKQRSAQIVKLLRANEKLEKQREKQLETDTKTLDTKWVERLAEQTKNVEKATEDYSNANSELSDLVDERNSFVDDLMTSARSFVNGFELAQETIAKYTRLDGVGSFSLAEEQKTKSFKDTIKERLASLKEWWNGVAALRDRGLDEDLIKELVKAGPESSAEAVRELSQASGDVLSEVNQIQRELLAASQNMADDASDAWFNRDISQQSDVVAGLLAIQTAAEEVYADLERQRDKELADLESSYEGYNDAIGKQITENQAKITKLTKQMYDRLKTLRTEFRKSGILAVDGLIAGMEERETDVKRAATRIADILAKAMKKALGINSPSKVGMYIGQMVNAGLAEGLASSVGDVQAASIRVANSSLPVPSGVGGAAAATEVRVFIGDTELTDIVRTEIKTADDASLNHVLSGRRF